MTKPLASGGGRAAVAAHTPGPWETRRAVTPDNTGGYDWAITKDGKVLAEAFENVGYATDGETYDKRPAQANARLIAAAPELLEALEEARELVCKTWCDERDTDCPHCLECQDAQAAIARATGAA